MKSKTLGNAVEVSDSKELTRKVREMTKKIKKLIKENASSTTSDEGAKQ